MSETVTLPDLDIDLDAPPVDELSEDDEPADAAHVVTQKDLIHSQITGQPIRALCGKFWVPKRNPDNFPMCQACVELLNATAGRR